MKVDIQPKINLIKKQKKVQSFYSVFDRYSSVLIISFKGMETQFIEKLRANLTNKGAKLLIAKNTLIKQGLENSKFNKIVEYLNGQNMFIFSNDFLEVLSILSDFKRLYKKRLPSLNIIKCIEKNYIYTEEHLVSLQQQYKTVKEIQGTLLCMLTTPIKKLSTIVSQMKDRYNEEN
jgi:large subunit ribosomal protein L10